MNIAALSSKYKGYRYNLKNIILSSVETNFHNESKSYFCVYCGKRLSNSKSVKFDHFHPKEHHPELSLFTKNIIPSCNECNSGYKKNTVNSYNIDILYPVSPIVLSEKFRILVKLDIDIKRSKIEDKVLFVISAIHPDPKLDNLIRELSLNDRINEELSRSKYHFFKTFLSASDKNAYLEQRLKQYKEESDIHMMLLVDCLRRPQNVSFLKTVKGQL